MKNAELPEMPEDTVEIIEGPRARSRSRSCRRGRNGRGAGTVMVGEFGIEAAFIVALVVMGAALAIELWRAAGLIQAGPGTPPQ